MGTVLHGAHAPKLERQVSLDDWLCDGEIDRIAREREGSNLKNTSFKPPCWCRECVGTDGQRHSMPVQHSCEYVAAKSALIFKAERLATRQVDSMLYGDQWTKVFASILEQLAAPLLNGSNGNGNGSERERQSVQNCETNGGPVSSGRNRIDASSAVVPMW